MHHMLSTSNHILWAGETPLMLLNAHCMAWLCLHLDTYWTVPAVHLSNMTVHDSLLCTHCCVNHNCMNSPTQYCVQHGAWAHCWIWYNMIDINATLKSYSALSSGPHICNIHSTEEVNLTWQQRSYAARNPTPTSTVGRNIYKLSLKKVHPQVHTSSALNSGRHWSCVIVRGGQQC